MLHYNKRAFEPPPNMEDLLTGTCSGCEAATVLTRAQAQPPSQRKMTGIQPGTWTDLWTCACSNCGARVYLHKYTPPTNERVDVIP